MKTVYIIGDDKLGHQAIAALGPDHVIYRNSSNSPMRVLKLVRKGILRADDLLRMVIAEVRRKDTAIHDVPALCSNADVQDMVEREKPDRVICFRAGLIIGRKTLDTGPQFLNLHYADLPDWGGLASIPRALRAGALVQTACLHVMAPEIDGGEVLAREPYALNPNPKRDERSAHRH